MNLKKMVTFALFYTQERIKITVNVSSNYKKRQKKKCKGLVFCLGFMEHMDPWLTIIQKKAWN